jgi:hypothetical protein
MARLLVSLDVMSDSLTLEELTRVFGLSLSQNSFSLGEIDDIGRVYKYSLLRFESSAGDDATCDEHIANLKPEIDRIDARLDRIGGIDVNLLLNVGLLFADAYGSVEFAPVALRTATVPLRISVSAYPVGDPSSD